MSFTCLLTCNMVKIIYFAALVTYINQRDNSVFFHGKVEANTAT